MRPRHVLFVSTFLLVSGACGGGTARPTTVAMPPAPPVSTSLVEMLDDVDRQVERWLVTAGDSRRIRDARRRALARAYQVLAADDARLARESGRLLALATETGDVGIACRLAADVPTLSPDGLDGALARLASTRGFDATRCSPATFDRATPSTRRILVARSFAPRDALFTRSEIDDPSFASASTLDDALVFATQRRDRVAVERYARRLVAIEPFDAFAVLALAALEDPAPGALEALDAYFATVTMSRGECADATAAATLVSFARSHGSAWAAIAIEIAGFDYERTLGTTRYETESRVALDRDEPLATVAEIHRAIVQRLPLPAALGDSAFYGPPLAEERTPARPSTRCAGLTGRDVTEYDNQVRLGVYDHAPWAIAAASAFSNVGALDCLAEELGEPARPLVAAARRVVDDAEPILYVLAELLDERPDLFTPFERVMIAALRRDAATMPPGGFTAIASVDPYTWVTFAPSGSIPDPAEPTTLSERLLAAVAQFKRGKFLDAAEALLAVADATVEPNEVLALAGVAFARAVEQDEAKRIFDRLAAVDVGNARRFAIGEVTARYAPNLLPGLARFSPSASATREPRESPPIVPILGRRSPSLECHRESVFDSAVPETTVARIDAMAAILSATPLDFLPSERREALARHLAELIGTTPRTRSFYVPTIAPEDREPLVARASSIPDLACVVSALLIAFESDPSYISADSRRLGETCAAADVSKEGVLRAVAARLHARIATPIERDAFLRATEARVFDATSVDLLDARAIALGSVGRDEESTAARLRLLSFGVLAPLDASTLRSADSLRDAYRLAERDDGRFAVASGRLEGVDAAARKMGRRYDAASIASETRDGILDRRALATLFAPTTTIDVATIAETATRYPRSVSVARWAAYELQYRTLDPAERTSLLRVAAPIFRTVVAERPEMLDDVFARAFARLGDRRLLRATCRAIEVSALASGDDGESFAYALGSNLDVCRGLVRTRAIVEESYDEEY